MASNLPQVSENRSTMIEYSRLAVALEAREVNVSNPALKSVLSVAKTVAAIAVFVLETAFINLPIFLINGCIALADRVRSLRTTNPTAAPDVVKVSAKVETDGSGQPVVRLQINPIGTPTAQPAQITSSKESTQHDEAPLPSKGHVSDGRFTQNLKDLRRTLTQGRKSADPFNAEIVEGIARAQAEKDKQQASVEEQEFIQQLSAIDPELFGRTDETEVQGDFTLAYLAALSLAASLSKTEETEQPLPINNDGAEDEFEIEDTVLAQSNTVRNATRIATAAFSTGVATFLALSQPAIVSALNFYADQLFKPN